MFENQNKTNDQNNNYIIPEWKRAKDAIIDSYLLTINSLAEVLPKFYIRKVLPQTMLDDWRKGIVSLFYQIREHEAALMQIKDVQNHINKVEDLIKFTELVLETKTLKDIKAISRKRDYDPVVEYRKEAYK